MNNKMILTHPIMWFLYLNIVAGTLWYFLVPTDSGDLWSTRYAWYLLGPTVATAYVLYVAKFYGYKGVEGKVWTYLGAGMLIWTVAEWLFAYYDLAGDETFPSAADYFYIAGYVPFMLALAIKAKESLIKADIRRITAIAASVFLMITITLLFLVDPVMDSEYDNYGKTLSLLYPILDIALVALSIAIITAFWGGTVMPSGWILVAGGMLVMTAADVIYSVVSWNFADYAQTDLLWLLSYLLVMAGALHQKKLHESFMGE